MFLNYFLLTNWRNFFHLSFNIKIFHFHKWKIILLVIFWPSSSSSLYDKTNSLFTLWKLQSIQKAKYSFWACVFPKLYLFQLIVLLNPDFNCSNNFLLSWVDKVTTGTYSFVSAILNLVLDFLQYQLLDYFFYNMSAEA